MKEKTRSLTQCSWRKSAIGRPKTISDPYLDRLRELVSNSPRTYGYPFERWTAHWLRRHLAKEFDIEVSDRHINRLLTQMGLSTRQRKANLERVRRSRENASLTFSDLNPCDISSTTTSGQLVLH
jgi:transposase